MSESIDRKKSIFLCKHQEKILVSSLASNPTQSIRKAKATCKSEDVEILECSLFVHWGQEINVRQLLSQSGESK